jgi:hypothetical protein
VAVDNKSSLARERLVDFTGELQVRQKREDDIEKPVFSEVPFSKRTPEWRLQFIAEPSQNGGRYVSQQKGSQQESLAPSVSPLYAQELAPIPLQLTPPSRLPSPMTSGVARGRLHGNDIEPFYHTSFCNELLCHPRILHSCSKKIITLKVELRELEWNEPFKAYFAHLPENRTAIHNTRRGPFLVQNAFTTCSFRNSATEHHFIDDFKVKLPFDLRPGRRDGTSRNLALVFTVYGVKIGVKNIWKRAIKFSSSPTEHESMILDPSGKARLDQIACGVLPLSSLSCILDDGIHDVRVSYKAKSPPKDLCDQGSIPASSLILVEDKGGAAKDDSLMNETASHCDDDVDTDMSVASVGSFTEDSFVFGKQILSNDPISLSVRRA